MKKNRISQVLAGVAIMAALLLTVACSCDDSTTTDPVPQPDPDTPVVDPMEQRIKECTAPGSDARPSWVMDTSLYDQFEQTMAIQVVPQKFLEEYISDDDLICAMAGDQIRALSGAEKTDGKYYFPLVVAGNGNEGEIPTMQIEVSADGENWTKLGDVNYSLIKRNWKRTKVSYEENGEVYVRILHTAAKSSGQVYDVYVMNNGEYSQTYSESALDAIATLQPEGNIIRTEVYGLDGTRRGTLTKGVNIVRQTYANGVVSTRKVLVK